MRKATLTNNLTFHVRVSENNAGVFRNLQVLGPGQSLIIETEERVTSRQYILVQLPENRELRPLSVDDIEDFNEIEIYEVSPGEFSWRVIPPSVPKKKRLEHVRAFWSTLRGGSGSNAGTHANPAPVAHPNPAVGAHAKPSTSAN